MTLQHERNANCFICRTLKNNCKIIQNQDNQDAICKEDFIELLTKDNENFNLILTPVLAEKAWKNIDSKGYFPVS